MRRVLPCVVALSSCLWTVRASAETVDVAVAANFTAPIQEIATAFEEDTGHAARLSFGSTGSLYAQIDNGAPFQVLLAADDSTPARLVADGLGVDDSVFTYATGRLVLWSAESDRVDDGGKVLRDASIERLALANPELAPYGAAAIETLRSMGLLKRLQGALVLGENIA